MCAVRGHELVGTDAAELRPQDALLAREDPPGTRWYRCLRCDSWLALGRRATRLARPPPEREEIELPLRGKPLRDKIVLRLIAIDRAFHLVVLSALGVLVLVFAADRRTLRDTFYKVVADLQGGVSSGQAHATPRAAAQARQRLHHLLLASAPARRGAARLRRRSRGSRPSGCGISAAGRST